MTIGGEFEIDPALLPTGRTALDAAHSRSLPLTGRTALHQILRRALRDRPDATVHLPDYACESMVFAARATSAPVHFYPLDEQLRARADADFPPGAIVVLVAYFGLVDVGPAAERLRRDVAGVHLVRDAVHAPWDRENLAGTDVVFTSWRKAYAVPDGAPIHPPFDWAPFPGDVGDAITYQRLAAGLVKQLKRHSPLDDSTYLQMYKRAEEHLNRQETLTTCSTGLSAAMMLRLDHEAIHARRRQNFVQLEALLAPHGLPPIVPLAPVAHDAAQAIPLFYPVRVHARDRVRAKLAAKGIYCPAHWPRPEGMTAPSAEAEALYDEELSLVVDQRYGEEDMARLAAEVIHARREL